MSSLAGLPVPGHTAHAGSAGLSQLISSGQPQSLFLVSQGSHFVGHGSACFLQSQSSNDFLHLSHDGFGVSHGHAGPVTTGIGSAQGAGISGTAQGQAAIA